MERKCAIDTFYYPEESKDQYKQVRLGWFGNRMGKSDDDGRARGSVDSVLIWPYLDICTARGVVKQSFRSLATSQPKECITVHWKYVALLLTVLQRRRNPQLTNLVENVYFYSSWRLFHPLIFEGFRVWFWCKGFLYRLLCRPFYLHMSWINGALAWSNYHCFVSQTE